MDSWLSDYGQLRKNTFRRIIHSLAQFSRGFLNLTKPLII